MKLDNIFHRLHFIAHNQLLNNKNDIWHYDEETYMDIEKGLMESIEHQQ